MFTSSLSQEPAWHRNTTETLDWVKADLWVGKYLNWQDKNWRIVLEGIRGVDFTGDIAVDDIFYTGCYRKCSEIRPLKSTYNLSRVSVSCD